MLNEPTVKPCGIHMQTRMLVNMHLLHIKTLEALQKLVTQKIFVQRLLTIVSPKQYPLN